MDHFAGWVARKAPDVVCLQEIKVEQHRFPEQEFNEAGYRVICFGQKTYNGVAIAARFGLDIEDVKCNLDGDEDEAPRRCISATVEGIRIVNVYVPNGQSVESPAFAYKLTWLERLRQEMMTHYKPEQELVLCGDFNVAPEPIDVHDPGRWEGSVLFHPEERARLRALMDWGLVDAFRELHREERAFSWWDYRMGAYRRNIGLRIDLMLTTRSLFKRCKDVFIDRWPRDLDRPSDHAPVVVEIE